MLKNFLIIIIPFAIRHNLNKLRRNLKLIKDFPSKMQFTIKVLNFKENNEENEENQDIFLNHADQLKAIFIHIPKTGGNSIQKALFENPSVHVPWSVYYNKNSEKFNRFFKFAVVRNPWDRLVSAFFYLKNGGMNNEDKQWADENIQCFETFEDFVLGWLNKNNVYKWTHFVPQTYWICDENKRIMIDYIARLETIDEDFIFIANKVGSVQKNIEKINSSERADYKTYYSQRSIEVVRSVYNDDIELLGYSFDNSI